MAAKRRPSASTRPPRKAAKHPATPKRPTSAKVRPIKAPRIKSAPQPHIPLVRASLAISLDGCIAAPDGGVDWLNRFFTPEIDFAGFMRAIGATIMGRRTFDESLARGMPPAADSKALIITHRPLTTVPPGVLAISGDLKAPVLALKNQLAGSGEDIWLMGGGQAIDAMLAAGLVDRLELSIMPILLGDGIPFFLRHDRGDRPLRLIEIRSLSNGIVTVTYEPTATA